MASGKITPNTFEIVELYFYNNLWFIVRHLNLRASGMTSINYMVKICIENRNVFIASAMIDFLINSFSFHKKIKALL